MTSPSKDWRPRWSVSNRRRRFTWRPPSADDFRVTCATDESKTPLVIGAWQPKTARQSYLRTIVAYGLPFLTVACGSFSPPTYLHLCVEHLSPRTTLRANPDFSSAAAVCSRWPRMRSLREESMRSSEATTPLCESRFWATFAPNVSNTVTLVKVRYLQEDRTGTRHAPRSDVRAGG